MSSTNTNTNTNTNTFNRHTIILAAGQGTRMKSSLPKVLHTLGAKPLLQHVLDAAKEIQRNTIHLVYGHQGDVLKSHFSQEKVNWVLQSEQRGTGHAVSLAMRDVPDDAQVLILYGDVPLINARRLEALLEKNGNHQIGLLIAQMDDPSNYGRIVRDQQAKKVLRIVEEKDASLEEKKIKEINTGILCAPAVKLRKWLNELQPSNAQGEYYLTDIIAMAVTDGVMVRPYRCFDLAEIQGINDKAQLAELEGIYQRRQAERLLRAGVTLADPARFDLRGTLHHGEDCYIDTNVILEGVNTFRNRIKIGTGCVLKNCTIGDDVVIEPYSILENVTVNTGAQVGPFARLRTGVVLGRNTKVGNFVEMKNTQLGDNSKANHLAYLGDTVIGRNVNVGAGVITCNYDGVNKHRTIIGDGAFIGSDVQLVAPVTVAANATIGAGTTLTKNAPADQLTLSRTPQKTIENWQRPQKKTKVAPNKPAPKDAAPKDAAPKPVNTAVETVKVAEPVKPVLKMVETVKPAIETVKPVETVEKPVVTMVETAQPVEVPEKPTLTMVETVKPIETVEQPVVTMVETAKPAEVPEKPVLKMVETIKPAAALNVEQEKIIQESNAIIESIKKSEQSLENSAQNAAVTTAENTAENTTEANKSATE